MFWTDWGRNPVIMRARMDGTLRSPVISTDLRWPNGIALDPLNEQLYWVDAGRDRIETTDINGIIRRTLDIPNVVHPFGMRFTDGFIYWSDWFRRSLYRKRVGPGGASGDSETLLLTSRGIPFGFTVVDAFSPRPGGMDGPSLSLSVCLSECLCQSKSTPHIHTCIDIPHAACSCSYRID